MQITHLEIERFGVWRNLSLPFSSPELNVVFGPNEAGKSTLMRFLRGVLFGFAPQDSLDQTHPASGLLEIEHRGEQFLMQRTGDSLSFTGDRELSGPDADSFLQSILGPVTKHVFDNVYCFGLDELQQLSVLSGEQIVEKLFGVSLGHKGKFILQALKDAERRKQSMSLGTEHKSSIRRLMADHDRTTRALEGLGDSRDRVNQLKQQLLSLEHSIGDTQQQQAKIEEERRGHQFMTRVHGPWSQAESLKRKLSEIPEVDKFPESGIGRLDELDRELEVLLEQRDALRGNERKIGHELEEVSDLRPILDELPAIRVLLDQEDRLVRQTQSPHAPDSDRHHSQDLEATLQEKLAEMGDDWNNSRLESLDLSPRLQQKLSQASQKYEETLKLRSQAQHKIEELSKANQQEQQELEQHSSSWQGKSAQQMLERTEQQLKSSHEHAQLFSRSTQLEEHLGSLEEQQRSMLETEPLPKGVHYFLTGFTIAGALLAILGIWQGMAVSGLAGAVYCLLGITCGGLGLALKWHFSAEQGTQLEKLSREAQNIRHQLTETQQQLEALGGSSLSTDPTVLIARMTTYQRCIEREEQWKEQRQEASELRSKAQEIQRDLGRDRDHWLQTLREIGLDETVLIDEGWEFWNRAAELKEMQFQIKTQYEQHSHQKSLQQIFETSVQNVQEQIHDQPPHTSLEDILSDWRAQFAHWSELRNRQQQLHNEQLRLRSESEDLATDIQTVRARRSQLLTEGGATDRQTFDQRAVWYLERTELSELLAIAEEELQLLIDSEPDLAILEDDLLEYDEQQIRQRLRQLQQELNQIEASLSAAFEQRGQLRQKKETLLQDQREPHLRQQLAELEEQIKQQCENWLGIDRAEQAIGHLKFTLEREQRPATLQRAEQYFRQLTAGRYQRVWAPLGEQDLHVEDHTGLARRLNQLSGGTREQLLLSLRLALVEEQRQQGIQLPFMLDDILVNFDETRVNSAMETLVEFSQQGTQTLLLTCHSHLAESCSDKGIAVTTLPEREHRPERLAG